MTASGGCDGPGLLAAFAAAVAHLEAHREEIDALNVFPVPDGDTGANMTATVRAGLAEAVSLPAAGRTIAGVAAAISRGALMGARGNSGVILSQVLRGMGEGLEGKRHVNGRDVARALQRGAAAAQAAVVRPVEGTILTVIREAAHAAAGATELEPAVERVLEDATRAAQRAVEATPALLAALRDAGVVDAGGQGLARLLEGALRHVQGGAPAATGRAARARRTGNHTASATAEFGYETMFLVTPGGAPLDLAAIRAALEALGESVLVADDGRSTRIHVHTGRPDAVLAYGLSLGTLSHISIENLDHQARDVRERRAAELVQAAPPLVERPVAVVAFASGDGLAAAFESCGAPVVVRGVATAGPDAGELLDAIRRAPSREILVLPNHPDVPPLAEQARKLCPEKRIQVVATRNAAEGLAALLAFDPTVDAATNAGPMLAAARAIQTVQVTRAGRGARLHGRRLEVGQAIALGPEDELLAAAGEPLDAALAGVATFRPGYELVTVYSGVGADRATAEEVARAIGAARPGVAVEVVGGGQPHCPFLIAAE